MHISTVAFSTAIFFLIGSVGWGQSPNILDDNDKDAQGALATMVMTGHLQEKRYAEAWVVYSSVALGMGHEKCNFPAPDDVTFIWTPALDGMSGDEIFTLNRVVTSNFRNAERNGRLLLDRLFPVTRQAVLMLSDGKGRWNCREISRVWDAARNYKSAKTDKPLSPPTNENTLRSDAQAIRKQYLDCLANETAKTAPRKLNGQDFSLYLKSTCRGEEMQYREALQAHLRDRYSRSGDVTQTTIASEIDKIIGELQSDFVGIYVDVTTRSKR